MVLDKLRGSTSEAVSPLARLLRNVNPDHITWLSFPFAITAGFLYFLSGPDAPASALLLFLALAAVGMTSLLDILDGTIARKYGKATPRGDYLDHVIDRFSDVAIFAGVAFSGWTDIRVGFFALSGVLLTSYMGTQAQAVGIKRNYGGILGRADRLAILSLATVIDIVLVATDTAVPVAWPIASALDAMMWWYAIAGHFTAFQRFFQGLRWFRKGAT